MKIISGKYKGRELEGFNITGTRPTMDRVKESLFATIQDYIPGSIVLDLFGGSGNLAIEALSNGASFSYVIDNNKIAIKTINNNIKNIGVNDIEVLKMDYLAALKFFGNNSISFDLIFLDPPYNTNYIENSINLITKYNLLNNNGLIVCESDNLNKIIYPDTYKVLKDKKYGDKYIVILEKI